MAQKMFTTSGMKDPSMPGKPSSVKSSRGALPPGSEIVDGFEAAKNFARMQSTTQTGSYTPLNRPGRIATRSVFPVAPTAMGLGKSGI